MNTDKTWIRFGEVDPYYGVFTRPQFHGKGDNLTEQAKTEFFKSGEEHAERVVRAVRFIDPSFSPIRTLEFGCGVGRVAIPLARFSEKVLAVDVSPGMLHEAEKNLRQRKLETKVSLSHEITGTFDFVHSNIVFQHISPAQGMPILRDIIHRVERGGIVALHFVYNRDAPTWRRLATKVKQTFPILNNVLNLARGHPFNHPTMTVFCYDASQVLACMRAAGFRRVIVELGEPFMGYDGLMLYAQKDSPSIPASGN